MEDHAHRWSLVAALLILITVIEIALAISHDGLKDGQLYEEKWYCPENTTCST